jgi:8-oxo-dGTP pyrophosphatase MutT (NUDIX family)
MLLYRGPGSSVSIVTDHEPDGLGIESLWGEVFHPSRPALGPPSLLYNGYRFFPGGKVRPGRVADHSPPSSVVVMEE